MTDRTPLAPPPDWLPAYDLGDRCDLGVEESGSGRVMRNSLVRCARIVVERVRRSQERHGGVVALAGYSVDDLIRFIPTDMLRALAFPIEGAEAEQSERWTPTVLPGDVDDVDPPAYYLRYLPPLAKRADPRGLDCEGCTEVFDVVYLLPPSLVLCTEGRGGPGWYCWRCIDCAFGADRLAINDEPYRPPGFRPGDPVPVHRPYQSTPLRQTREDLEDWDRRAGEIIESMGREGDG